MKNKKASIDIGTNTFRLLIGEVNPDGSLLKKIHKREITRLGGGYSPEKGLTPESMARAIRTLSEFSSIIKEDGVKSVRAVATSVVREAINGGEFVSHVKGATGITIDVINGDEEARLALKGVLSCVELNTPDSLIYDIGGGSTEYILAHGVDPVYSKSLRLGVVHETETFLKSDPPCHSELESVLGYAREKLQTFREDVIKKGFDGMLPPLSQEVTLIGTAGTITTLAAMDQGLEVYSPELVNNYILSRSAVKRHLDELSRMTLSERRSLKGIEKGREDLIVTGCLIVLETMDFFGFKNMTVSDGGLLEGILLDMCGIK